MDTTSVALLVGAYAISAVIAYVCWIRRLGVPFLLVAILVGAIYWSFSNWRLTFMTGGEVKFVIAVPVSVQVGESALVGSLAGGLVAWCISLVRRHRPRHQPSPS